MLCIGVTTIPTQHGAALIKSSRKQGVQVTTLCITPGARSQLCYQLFTSYRGPDELEQFS